MRRLRLLPAERRIRGLFFSAAAFAATAAPAAAATATYVAPSSIAEGTLGDLSTAGDGAGLFLGLGETLALVFDQPFATSRGSNVSIFTLPAAGGGARFEFRFGTYNGGAPSFINGRIRRRAGAAGSFGNLFQRGCRAFDGCDYVEIALVRTNRGATGAEVDYVAVDGEVAEVVSPTPEPSIWALAVAGFALTAWRMKAVRRRPRPDKADWRHAEAGMNPL